MRKMYFGFLECAALLLLSGVTLAQQKDGDNTTSTMRELLSIKSTDGRSHTIEAIALGRSGKADVLYVVEGISGEYVLRLLDTNGRELSKEIIADYPFPWPPSRAMIVPLSASEEGAIVVGMFEDEKKAKNLNYVYSFLRVDRSGKIKKSTRLYGGAGTFLSAALLPDAKAVLLAGSRNFGASVSKVDLDGNTLWSKEYLGKTDMSNADRKQHVASHFCGIAPIDETGAFIAAGDYGKITKMGWSEPSIWLVRCDATGKVVSETTFPGREPSIGVIGKDRFAILYNGVSGLVTSTRVRAIDLQLHQQWETNAPLTAIFIDGPAMSSIPSDQGFALAGCNLFSDKETKNARMECKFLQYDASGQIVTSATAPVEKETFLFTHIACGTDRAYVAIQTKGKGPRDAREAGIFEIQLNKRHP